MAKRKYQKRWLKAEHWYKMLMYELERSETVIKYDRNNKPVHIGTKVPPAVRARIMADIFKAIVTSQARQAPRPARTPEESKFNAENAMKALKELTDGRSAEIDRDSGSMDARGSDLQIKQNPAEHEGRLGSEPSKE